MNIHNQREATQILSTKQEYLFQNVKFNLTIFVQSKRFNLTIFVLQSLSSQKDLILRPLSSQKDLILRSLSSQKFQINKKYSKKNSKFTVLKKILIWYGIHNNIYLETLYVNFNIILHEHIIICKSLITTQ